MKSDHARIVLLGSNSGRNLGDAAILASVMDVLSAEIPDAEFIVPTTGPSFVNTHYSKKYNVRGVSMMPWTGSIRFLGIPTFYHIARSDIALICDGIIFGKKLWNPFFNWLIALVFVVPWARLTGCKVVCYSCGVGPFRSKISRLLAKWTIQGCDLIIMREHDSEALTREIGVTKPIMVTGDAAFLNRVEPDTRAVEILAEKKISLSKPLFGVNVTKYVDTWLAADERLGDRDGYLKLLAEGINRARLELVDGFQPIVFSTHPMDEEFAWKLAMLLDTAVIDNSKYLSHEIQAVMRRCELFMGMRFHSVVLASAVESPVIGLVYAPKVRGFMRQLGCADYALELAALTPENLCASVLRGWNDRKELKARQKQVIDELKLGARRAATLVRERYFSVPELLANKVSV